jgi:RNA polymerase sigma-70 factor, ECF subfamily
MWQPFWAVLYYFHVCSVTPNPPFEMTKSTNPAESATSATLLSQLRADEADAWKRLVFLYGPLVRTWAGRKGVVGADAEDVEQEVFRVVVARLADFRRDRPGDSFRGWLFGITRNALLTHHRKTSQQPQAGGGTEFRQVMDAVPDPHDGIVEEDPNDRAELYHRGLELVRNEFETRTWQMFWQHTVDGQTAADVGAHLGVTSAAVRQAKSRVLRRLREVLGDLLDTPTGE